MWCGQEFDYQLQESTFSARLLVDTDAGSKQIDNLPVQGLLPVNKIMALQALICAGISLDADKCRVALGGIALSGRQQQLCFQGKNIILDVAHNPAAAGLLAQNLTKKPGRKIAVASVLDDKDWSAMVTALMPVIDDWKIAELQGVSRASEGYSLVKLLYNRGLQATLFATVKKAFFEALASADSNDSIIVFGSFHTVAQVMELISAEVTGE